MPSTTALGRAARAYLTAALPFSAGLLAGYLHETVVPTSWHGGPPELPDLLVTGAFATAAVTAAWNLAARARMRVVLVLASQAVGVSAALFAFALLVGATMFRPPAWWHVPTVVAVLVAAPVPAALAVRFTRRPVPRRTVDAVVLAIGLVGLSTFTAPLTYVRIAAMDADERHRAAVEAFGAPYLHARTLVESCAPFRDLAGPDPRVTISARRNALEERARETRGSFDFDYRGADGRRGSVRAFVRTDPDDAERFVPVSVEEDGTYTLYVTPRGDAGRLVPCPPLRP